jgi:monovalent cation:H+ antiporter-2, CPA2 family
MLAASPGAADLLVELGGILLVLAVLGRVAGKVGLPAIPLYLLAGLLVGEGGLVELTAARDFIEQGAQIGVILLLLMLGLEYTGDELMSALRQNSRFGALDLGLNFIPGLIAGFWFGWGLDGALLLGGITYISSSGIIAKVLDDLENTGNRETPVVLSILVTEDLVMAFYLPLMAGLLIGGDPWGVGLEIVIAVTAVVISLVIAVRFGSQISTVLSDRSAEILLLTGEVAGTGDDLEAGVRDAVAERLGVAHRRLLVELADDHERGGGDLAEVSGHVVRREALHCGAQAAARDLRERVHQAVALAARPTRAR